MVNIKKDLYGKPDFDNGTPPGKKPLKRNKELTKQKLIDAVSEIISREGYTGLGVNKIANQAMVSKKLIYKYFGTVDKLIELYKPSDRYIDLIEDSSLLTAGVNEVYRLQNEFPQIHSLGYSILSLAKQKSDERSALLMLNAKERYMQFCEHFPWTRIPVADAASYLGLTRETLSKIRSGR